MLLSPLAWAQMPERVPLPPGYEWPQTPSVHIPDPLFDPPSRGCASCSADGDLRLYYRDFAGFRRNLDRYAGRRVTWELLTFEHGFKAVWLGPHVAIRLYQHGAGQVRVVTRERLVVFEKVAAEDGSVALKCVSDDDWALARHDDRIRVTSPDRWFDFETPDLGATWRLAETAPRGTPLVVKLHYGGTGSLPTSLEYPDGKLAIIEPSKTNADAVGLIRLPNGIEFRIEYDPTTFPRLLEEWFPNPEPVKREIVGFQMLVKDGKTVKQTQYRDIPQPKLICIRRWAWENDHLGRIRHQVAPCDRELTLDYAESTSKETGKETLMILTDPADGSYTYLRHQEQASTWTIERGHGAKDQPIEQAIVEYRGVQRTIGHQRRLIEFQSGESAERTRIDYDRQGNETARKAASGDDTLRELPTQPAKQPSPWIRDGADRVGEYQQAGRHIEYKYDGEGYLESAKEGEVTHTFKVDKLGRVRLHDRPGGAKRIWAFNRFDQIETSTTDWGQGRSVTFTLVCDPWGRLILNAPDGLQPARFQYTCEGLAAMEAAGVVTRFKFRTDGQLAVRWTDAARYVFEYDAANRLKVMTMIAREGTGYRVVYGYDDAGSRFVRRTEGNVPSELLDARYAVRTHAPGTPQHGKTLSCNGLGGLVGSPPQAPDRTMNTGSGR